MLLKIKNVKKSKSLLLITLIAAAVIIGGLWLWQRSLNQDQVAQTTTNEPGDTDSSMNLDPPTEAEKNATEQHKDELAKQQASSNNSSNATNPAPVTPIITSAGQFSNNIEVSSFVPGIVESGGTCITKFTKGEQVVTKNTAALPDATTTRCPNLTIPKSEFPELGSWQVVVSYSSGKSIGKSETKVIEIR